MITLNKNLRYCTRFASYKVTEYFTVIIRIYAYMYMYIKKQVT